MDPRAPARRGAAHDRTDEVLGLRLRSALAGNPRLLTTFDLHQHLWPEALVRSLRARRDRPRLRGARLELAEGDFETDLREHDPARRLELLDRDGIDVAVISCPPTLDLSRELLDSYHEGIAEVVATSDGRLVALATGVVLDGFAGTCIAARALLDLDSLASLLDELQARGGFLFVHPGPAARRSWRPAWWAPVVEYTEEMQAGYYAWLSGGVRRWSDLAVVFAILAGGGPFQLERLGSRGLEAAAHPNVYLDTASYGARALRLCVDALGAGQLVYGSDTPVIDSRPTLRSVQSLGEAVEEALLRDNPARLLSQG